MFEGINADANLIAHLVIDHQMEIESIRHRFDDITLRQGALRVARWAYPDGIPEDEILPEGLEWLRDYLSALADYLEGTDETR